MGGGASSQGVEDLLATTYMLGRAIVAVTFPGMYRIYDFHSSKAPKIKNANPFPMFGGFNDDDDEDGENISDKPDPAIYEKLFNVKVAQDTIYIEDACAINEAGWTALHSCCMSYQTAEAAKALIDEMIRLGGNIDVKTINGPGTFNSGWTPLHMACAYGVEPVVMKLLECDANLNTRNSFGYTPLLEACHRGFINIAKLLIAGGADLRYMPIDSQAMSSPFVSSPTQAALAESSRCGFNSIVQALLDAGAPVDLQNSIGWSALHEACFYNRIEVVKALILHGASTTLRTKVGALPYHLCALSVIRNMLKDMGGDDAMPKEGDVVDMIEIMKELTTGSFSGSSDNDDNRGGHGGFAARRLVLQMDPRTGEAVMLPVDDVDDEEADDDGSGAGSAGEDDNEDDERNIRKEMLEMKVEGDINIADTISEDQQYQSKPKNTNKKNKSKVDRDSKITADNDNNSNTTPNKQKLLHSGGVLGDLPALNTNNSSLQTPGAAGTGKLLSSPSSSTNDAFLDRDLHAVIDGRSPTSGLLGSNSSNTTTVIPAINNTNLKKKNKKKQNAAVDETIATDMPSEFMCELCKKLLSDPVKTIYGNVYERQVILDWFKNQGHIDPITGAPLAEPDLRDMDELKQQITSWILKKSMGNSSSSDNNASPYIDYRAAPKTKVNPNNNTSNSNGILLEKQTAATQNNRLHDDLYEF